MTSSNAIRLFCNCCWCHLLDISHLYLHHHQKPYDLLTHHYQMSQLTSMYFSGAGFFSSTLNLSLLMLDALWSNYLHKGEVLSFSILPTSFSTSSFILFYLLITLFYCEMRNRIVAANKWPIDMSSKLDYSDTPTNSLLITNLSKYDVLFYFNYAILYDETGFSSIEISVD